VGFHPVRRLTREDVAQVVALIPRRDARLLERRGVAGSAEDGEALDVWSEEAPLLAAVAAASVEGRVALGPRPGARVRRCGDPPEEVRPTALGPCHANAGGFDLHAGLMTHRLHKRPPTFARLSYSSRNATTGSTRVARRAGR
jgi:hypothetical protein